MWERVKPTVHAEMSQTGKWLAALAARLKAGVAEIAATKSSQRSRREEEKE